ncbi:hypothetical protein TSAR_002378 [Trichomalopsis sarcophagae]|uniref:Uncharacterized protein n=1 Tax=Trichomalopsis sarcophagae TaxID=543379 RepID=A0A232FIM6_9HYME|nr:hypothetical protein TSAR_002378 [Trichomalopsis sarcophagae]
MSSAKPTTVAPSAGMQVGKWAANQEDLLRGLSAPGVDCKDTIIQEQEAVSALGLRWLAKEDAFCFSIEVSEVPSATTVTNRSILATTAKLFDPVGWLSPIIVRAKILIQKLWLQKLDWDDSVPEVTSRSWMEFITQLKELEAIKIPRWIGTYQKSEWLLHGFCHASERAYTCAIYAIMPNQVGHSVKLLATKSKVAPIKVLELCGAVILSRLAAYILSKVKRKPSQQHFWSDSKVVLAWLQAHLSKWKPFIGNRVSEIMTSLPDSVWHHVKSADNPTDLATRGVSLAQLQNSRLWWKGPAWLSQPADDWPCKAEPLKTTLEARNADKILGFTALVPAELTTWRYEFKKKSSFSFYLPNKVVDLEDQTGKCRSAQFQYGEYSLKTGQKIANVYTRYRIFFQSRSASFNISMTQHLRTGSHVSDDEIRQAEEKFAESLHLAQMGMFNLLENDLFFTYSLK